MYQYWTCFPGFYTTPRRTPLRIVFLVFWLTSLCIYSSYTATLTASLSVQNPYLPFRTLDEALSDLDWKIGIRKGSAIIAIINVSSYHSLPYYSAIIVLLYKLRLLTLRRFAIYAKNFPNGLHIYLFILFIHLGLSLFISSNYIASCNFPCNFSWNFSCNSSCNFSCIFSKLHFISFKWINFFSFSNLKLYVSYKQ